MMIIERKKNENETEMRNTTDTYTEKKEHKMNSREMAEQDENKKQKTIEKVKRQRINGLCFIVLHS